MSYKSLTVMDNVNLIKGKYGRGRGHGCEVLGDTPLKASCDSYATDTAIQYPTDVCLLHDAL